MVGKRDLLFGFLLCCVTVVPSYSEVQMGISQIFGTGLRASTIASGDLNGNGFDDIAVANIYSHTITVAYNNGEGHFENIEEVPLNGKLHPVAVTIGDVDGDGWNDLVVVHIQKFAENSETPYDDAEVVVLYGGEDEFPSLTQDYGIWGVPSWIEVADYNGDGDADILVGNNGNFVFRNDFIGQTDGGLYPYLNVDERVLTPTKEQTIEGSLVHFTTIDYNDDGFMDVVGVDQGTLGLSGITGELLIEFPKIQFFEGSLSGLQHQEDRAIDLNYRPWSIDSADFNDDGLPDLAVAMVGDMDEISFLGTNASVDLFQHTGASFVRNKKIPTSGVAFYVMAEDFDMDGDIDIAVTVQEIVETEEGNLLVPYLKVFELNEENDYEETVSLELQEEPRYATVADFDQDGDLDIAIICSIIDVGGEENAYNGQVYIIMNEAITSVSNWSLY